MMNKEFFEIFETRGLPNGPNEQFTYTTGIFSYSSPFDVYQAPSNIEGNGMFAGRPYKKGEMIGLAHQDGQPASELGKMHNHNENSPTMVSKKEGNQRYVYASKDLKKGDELTTNYRMQPELEQPEDFQMQLGGESRCWPGYRPVPGKKAYSSGSCKKAQDGAEIKYPNLIDYSVDGVSGAAKKADKDIVSIARRWADNQTDGRRPALGLMDRLRSIFAGEDGCVNDNTCVQVVKEIVNEAAFNHEGQRIEGAPYIPRDIYNNREFRKNFRDYGFVEVRPEDGGERFREDELQPGDIIQYYYNEDSPDVKEGDSYIGFPYHMGVYDNLDQYISDGDSFFPVMRNNMFTNEEGKRKDPFYVYRRKQMQEGGGVNEEGVKQYKFLKEYINSPMYVQRLKMEFPDYTDKQIAEEVKTRLENIMQTRVGFLPESSEYSESIGDVQGFVDPENFPNMMMLRPEYSALTPDNPPYSYNTTPIHEWQHVADEVGNRMSQSTRDLISSFTKDNSLDMPKEDYYYTQPTEIIARIQELRYLLDDQGIYDAKKDKFTQEDLDKAKKNDRIRYNARFQDLMDNLKSDEALIELMNSIAAIDTGNQDGIMMAQSGGPVYDQKEFLKEWSNSPMGQKLLLESLGGNEKALERLTKKRTGNLDTVSINMDEDLEGLGRYRSNDHSIRLNPSTKDFQQVGDDYDSVLLHELSHSQDYTPGSEFNKLTIPLSDQKLIRNLSKDSIKNAEDRKTKKENRYLADPTETRARLNVVRDTYEKFKEEDMPSVFDSEFTPSMLEEVKGTSQFEELQQIFSDEEIIQLLNTVAYQKGNKDFKGYAQLGGSVRNLIKKAGPKVMKYLDNLFSKTDDVVKSTPAIAKQKGLYEMLPIKKLDSPTHYGTIDIDDGTITNVLDAMKAQGKYADDIGYSIDDLVGSDIQYLGDISGRTIVNVPLPNGKSQLFYKSTGLAGKKGSGVGGTSEGLWQPYGGHASVRGFPGHGYVDNWFIKDSGYADYYGSESFKNIANKLDEIATEQGWDMSNQMLRSNKKQFGGPVLKKLIKKGAIYLDDVVKRFSDDAGEFASEIDWSKWNKEIPDNKALMQEYNLIEQTTKANKTWMKNADGTPFSGTPEQFVQMNSKNFKNAFPEGYQSVYRGVEGEDIKNYGPLGVNTNRTDIGPGIFTGDEIVANSYKGNPGHTLNLAMKNSDNSLRLEGLGNWHADLNTIGASKQILKKNIDNLKRQIKELGKNAGDYNPNSASSKEARLESYENFYNNYDEIVSNPVYKRLVEYKKEVLEAGKKVKTAPGANSFATDDLAVFLEREGLDNIQLRYVDDGMMGNTNISNQVPGNYLKSLQGNNGMFDMSNPDIYKQKGGEYDPYMDIDSTAQKRRTELTNAINKVVDSQGGDENLRALLTMTAFMENSLGANPDAYGRDYTRGVMSIDDIAYKNMFEKRKGARDYTTSQKKYFDWFEGLGFDLENMDKHLRENVLANVAAARYQYGNAPAALPSKDDAEAMYKYYMDFYNRTDADHRDRFMKGYDAFIKQKEKGGDVEVMNLYKKYLMGGDTSKQGQMVYDKLNRLFYNDAKQRGMTPQNYIMTYLAGDS